MSAIYNWLEESTGLQARALPFTDALWYLVETQKLKHHGQEADPQRLLAKAQDQIDQFLVSFWDSSMRLKFYELSLAVWYQWHPTSPTHRKDLTSGGIESEDEDDEDEKDPEEDDEALTDLPSSETNSSKRKRARRTNSYSLPIQYVGLTATTSITFELFDELLIWAQSKSIWNKLLLANLKFWRSKCQTWYCQFHEAFEVKNDVFIFLLLFLWRLIQKFLDQSRYWSPEASCWCA